MIHMNVRMKAVERAIDDRLECALLQRPNLLDLSDAELDQFLDGLMAGFPVEQFITMEGGSP